MQFFKRGQKSAPSGAQRRMVRDALSPKLSVLRRVTVRQWTKPLSESFRVTVRRLPNLSTLWLTVLRLPELSIVLVTLFWLPKTSTPVRVTVTESADAVPAKARVIASVAVIAAMVFMAAFPFGCRPSELERHAAQSRIHDCVGVLAITPHGLLMFKQTKAA
jgi:hypothetical protein